MLVLIRKSNGDFVFEDSQSLVTDESGKVSVISAEGGCEPCEKLCEGDIEALIQLKDRLERQQQAFPAIPYVQPHISASRVEETGQDHEDCMSEVDVYASSGSEYIPSGSSPGTSDGTVEEDGIPDKENTKRPHSKITSAKRRLFEDEEFPSEERACSISAQSVDLSGTNSWMSDDERSLMSAVHLYSPRSNITICSNISTPTRSELPDVSSVISPAKDYAVHPEVPPPTPKKVAVVQVINDEVIISTVVDIIHDGHYSGKLATSRGSMLIGFIYNECTEQKFSKTHVCTVSDELGKGSVVFTRMGNLFDMSSRDCIKRGVLKGTQVYIEFTNTHIADLIYVKTAEHVALSAAASHGTAATKTKRHCCIFCKKLVTQIARHFRLKHAQEEDVRAALGLENRKERDDAWLKLRLRGDALFNLSCPVSERIFVRNPTVQPATDGVLCPNCQGMFAKREFSRHQRKCTDRPSNRQHVTEAALQQQQVRQQQVQLQSEPQIQSQQESQAENLRSMWRQKLYDQITQDNLKELIQTDRCLRLMASYFACKFSGSSSYKTPVQHLRLCARLLAAIKRLRPEVQSLEEALTPGNYELLMDAVSEVTAIDRETGELRKASTAVLYNHLIARMISCLYSYYVKSKSPACTYAFQLEALRDLNTIHAHEFKMYISKKARRTIADAQITKKKEIPTLEDTKLFSDYVREQANKAEERLRSGLFDYMAWCTLGKCVMLQLLVFNRKRTTEISEILLTSFHKRETITNEQLQYMNVMQKALANEFSVMTIVAKRNRKVPVLIYKDLVRKMELYLSYRQHAGIHPSNPYLFCSVNKTGHLDGVSVIREYANKCGAKNPENIRSTRLRKQIATISQMLMLSDNEIRQLADFMGHSFEVHCSYYRTPEINTQITKLAKLFMTLENVNPSKFRGKSIEDLDVDSVLQQYQNNDPTVDSETDEESLEEEDTSTPVIDDDLQPAEPLIYSPIGTEAILDDGQFDNQQLSNSPSGLQLSRGSPTEILDTNAKKKSKRFKHQLSQITTRSKKAVLHSVEDSEKSSTTPKKRRTFDFTPKKTAFSPVNKYQSPQMNNSKVRRKVMWSTNEKKIMMKVFGKYIVYAGNGLPSMALCNEVAKKYRKYFRCTRTARIIYAWVRCEKLRRHK